MFQNRYVKVFLSLDSKGFTHATKETESSTDKLTSHLKGAEKGVSKLKSILAYGAGAIGVSSLAFGIDDVVKKTGELAEEVEQFHATSGIGAEQSLQYTEALKARGIATEAGANAFKFLAKNIQLAERQEYTHRVGVEKAALTGKAYTSLLGVQAGAFKELGINLQQFSGLTSAEKFKTITGRFEAMKDGVDKTRLAVQLFGRGGTALLPVLEAGSLSLKHYTELVKKFFPTLKGEGVKGLQELLEKQAESKLAWEGLEFTLGQKLLPVVTAVLGWFSKIAGQLEHGKGLWKDLRTDVGAAASVIGLLIEQVRAVVGWFERTKTALEALKISLYVMTFGLGYVVTHLETLKKVGGEVTSWLGKAFDNAANGIIKAINLIIKGIDDLIKGYNSVQKSIPFGLGAARVGEIGLVGELGKHHGAPGRTSRRTGPLVPALPGGLVFQPTVVVEHKTYLNNRVLTEGVTTYAKQRQARK